jgi:hypothetical protein
MCDLPAARLVRSHRLISGGLNVVELFGLTSDSSWWAAWLLWLKPG